MKLTLSSFLYNTLESKLKPRWQWFKEWEEKKNKKLQQGKEKTKQVSITEVKAGIPYK